MNTNLEVNVGMKFCKDCEYNLKCLECVYPKKYEALASNHDILLEQADELHKKLEIATHTVKEITVKAYSKLAKTTLKDYPDMEYYLYGTIEEMVGAENG